MKYLVLILLCTLSLGEQAKASLGGNSSSVESDRSAVRAGKRVVSKTSTYSVHTMTVAGTTIKEYVTTDDVVFAVSWSGIARPDLSVLFGDHYNEYVAAKSANAHVAGRSPLAVQTNALVVKHGGHMRAINGHAYLPTLVPAGFNVEDLQ